MLRFGPGLAGPRASSTDWPQVDDGRRFIPHGRGFIGRSPGRLRSAVPVAPLVGGADAPGNGDFRLCAAAGFCGYWGPPTMSGIHFGGPHAPSRAGAGLGMGPRASGPLQRWPAGPKLAAMLVLVAGTAVLPVTWIWWYGAVGTLLVAAIVVGRVAVAPVLWRLVWFAPFVAGAALAAAWHGDLEIGRASCRERV